ncbi:hypothetical protein QOZ80_2BG0181610 [Eleusine coracana subsp. coracana]|nr:hypothetical protein QOZ80_2BG0181610 [Eleusine coracana subsp. coracana]
MAAITPLLRLLPVLLLLLPPALLKYLTASNGPAKDAGVGELHPIVLLAGLGCSDLEAQLTEAYQPSVPRCGAMKGKGWFSLWQNTSDLLAQDYVQCFEEQMRLFYDPAINDYRNLPGVETRVPKFGSARAFHDKNPLHPKRCLDNVREALEELGYRDNDTLFEAPYDWRHVPPVPGQISRSYSQFFQRFKELVETASSKHEKKVIIFAHSYGGTVALEFVRNMPLAWRNRYIKHLILSAPTLSEGFMRMVQGLISGSEHMIYVPTSDTSLRTLWRSFETSIMGLPSPKVFGHEPLVITKQRNYSAYDMEDFLAAIGLGDSIKPFRTRMIPKMNYFEAPMVPMTCMNGVGIRTPRQLLFWESDYNVSPEIVYGDGDGGVNLRSMTAFEEEMCRDPRQKRQFKSVKIYKVGHSDLVTEEGAIKRVVEEILEANRISY